MNDFNIFKFKSLFQAFEAFVSHFFNFQVTLYNQPRTPLRLYHHFINILKYLNGFYTVINVIHVDVKDDYIHNSQIHSSYEKGKYSLYNMKVYI